ncbi:MAG: PilN domain-containing protein [Burkholderiales bacterium]|nr:PilN domain-containing protein [Burkholderiales bacterium]
MIKINLLPHREAKRKDLKNRFYSLLLLAALIAAILIIVVGVYFSTQISSQNERNAFIKNENEILDSKIKEVANLKQEIDALKARQQAVEDLQGDRNQPVYMMNELIKLAPEGLYLTVIKQDGQRISIKGYAQSHGMVQVFFDALSSSPWMSKPEIIQNKAVIQGVGRDGKRVIEFDLNVGIRRPRELEQEVNKADAAKPVNAAPKKP